MPNLPYDSWPIIIAPAGFRAPSQDAHKERIAVRACLRDQCSAESTVCAGSIIDHNRLTDVGTEQPRDVAAAQILDAPRRERDDQPDWLGRIVLRSRRHRSHDPHEPCKATRQGGADAGKSSAVVDVHPCVPANAAVHRRGNRRRSRLLTLRCNWMLGVIPLGMVPGVAASERQNSPEGRLKPCAVLHLTRHPSSEGRSRHRRRNQAEGRRGTRGRTGRV